MNSISSLALGILDHTETFTTFQPSILTLNLLTGQFGSAMVDNCDSAGNVDADGKDTACTSCDRPASLHQSMGGGKGI